MLLPLRSRGDQSSDYQGTYYTISTWRGGVRGEERIYTTCPICLEDFTIGEEVLVLERTHLVHPGCVKN
jgi:hypothetical protein